MFGFVNIFTAAMCFFVALAIGLIAGWAFRRKEPMHFWAGTEVKPEEITDIPAYNRANGIMWAAYSVDFVLAGIVSLFSAAIGGILIGALSTVGIVILVIIYKRIYKKYRPVDVREE
jgi:hypothetical protein